MRRRLIFLVLAAGVAGGLVGAALALDSGSPSRARVVTSSLFGPAREGLDARMQQASDRGPYSITCQPDTGSNLNCTRMKDDDVIPSVEARRDRLWADRHWLPTRNGTRDDRSNA